MKGGGRSGKQYSCIEAALTVSCLNAALLQIVTHRNLKTLPPHEGRVEGLHKWQDYVANHVHGAWPPSNSNFQQRRECVEASQLWSCMPTAPTLETGVGGFDHASLRLACPTLWVASQKKTNGSLRSHQGESEDLPTFHVQPVFPFQISNCPGQASFPGEIIPVVFLLSSLILLYWNLTVSPLSKIHINNTHPWQDDENDIFLLRSSSET